MRRGRMKLLQVITFYPHLVYKSLFTLYCMQRESLLHSVGAVMKSIDFPFHFLAGVFLHFML
jgi:hypothetical protein